MNKKVKAFFVAVIVLFSSCGQNKLTSTPESDDAFGDTIMLTSESKTNSPKAMHDISDDSETHIFTSFEFVSEINSRDIEKNTLPFDKARKIVENQVEKLACSGSFIRFKEDSFLSQYEMSVEQIIELLVDKNIVCYYTFEMDSLVYDFKDRDESGYGNAYHYIFSNYTELNDFVYSTYDEKYASDLLSNLHGHGFSLYAGDDISLLYNPAYQGTNIFAYQFPSSYSYEINNVSEARIDFVITFEGDKKNSYQATAILQNEEWKLKTMFPDIQQKNPNIA